MEIETWTPAFIVSNNGTSVIELEALAIPLGRSDGEPPYSYKVRRPGLTKQRQPFVGSRWDAQGYERLFGATRQEAIEKGLRHAEHRVAWFESQLAAVQARLTRVRQLAAMEPQEQH
jgi:hypothetical protein